ncbi:ImmA/IrrE family metallo-endopeptidase [Microbacterium kunmingense]|uniref:ImmA/IrrE family metallo-endopeptidase n=1 Tax=Microbacterium kunmingense TaxID=2915939 RepID=UPI003D74A3A8
MTTHHERDIAHLIEVAEELGLHVVERRGHHRGGYHDGLRQIRLNPGMSARATRSFLAHEIAHALFRDTPSPYGPVKAKQERRAWEWAAIYLISPEAFAEAEEQRGGHTPAMAYDLGVTVELVEAFRRVLARIGDNVYVKPRMGVGQWDHRVDIAETA